MRMNACERQRVRELMDGKKNASVYVASVNTLMRRFYMFALTRAQEHAMK